VCRNVFAFVVVLIDENLSTTPAEEVPNGGVVDAVAVTTRAAPRATTKQAAPIPGHACSAATKVRFGRAKGKCICSIDEGDLDYQLSAARKAVEANDPKWGEANKKWLVLLTAEKVRRMNRPEAAESQPVFPGVE
jgi:hypothetical protein